VEAQVGDARISLPPSWVWAGLDQGVENVGDRLAPDDPQLASDLDERVRTLPRSALLIGLDESDLDPRQFNTNVVLLALPGGSWQGAEEMRAGVAADLEANGASVSSASYLNSGEGPVLRVRYTMRLQGIEVDSLQYWYTTSSGRYTLSVSSDELDDYVAVADAMASSFDA
jgi:hypothetical protein